MFQWFDKNIFNHVGRTIQRYAIISLLIDVVVCVIMALLLLGEDALISLIILACGLGYALIFAFPIYAFGQLVEDIHQTKENTQGNTPVLDELPDL